MIETIVLGLLTIFTLYYFYFFIRIHRGLLSLHAAPSISLQPIVTVIIAARDEEQSIGQCLQSLLQQSYPPNKFEIIVVDDGSSDSTASIVKKYSDGNPHLHLISLPSGADQQSGCKPLAITNGIAQAAGEIILTTDADCLVPPRWIEIMVNHFEEDVAFVAGPIAEQPSFNFFSQMEQLEFLGLMTTAAGLIGSGRPIICNGANLAYRKRAFSSAGGFGNDGSSNDDESLMNRIAYRNIGRIVFAPESDAVITTRSSNTITSFLRQRIRWANKRGRYEKKSILVTLVALYLFFLSFALAVLLIPFNTKLLLPVLLAFGIKVMIDYFILRSGARLFLQRVQVFHFLIAELLHVPYIVIASAVGQLSALKWKGRTIIR
jgi:cellulose synthase/poly-beta-1,6-N-acetylglucosamine synthase-like glycosyltransferase